MNFEKKLSDIFDLEIIQGLIDNYDQALNEEVKYLLLKNGNIIPLRRQINDYFTFSLKDQDQETIIIKTSKKPYSGTCTCRAFQSNDDCQHILTVLTSIKQQIQHDSIQQEIHDNKEQTEAQQVTDIVLDPTKHYMISDASDVSFKKLAKILPYLHSTQLPRKTVVNELESGLQVVCRNHTDKFFIDMLVDRENDLSINCSCGNTYAGHLCDHSRFALGYVAYQFNPSMFAKFLNHDVEKNRILADYGLTIDDKESREFDFTITDGKIRLARAPHRFMSIKAIEKIRLVISDDVGSEDLLRKRRKFIEETDVENIGICFCIDIDEPSNQPIFLEPYKSESNKKGSVKISRLPLVIEQSIGVLSNLDDERYDVLMDFGFERFKHFIKSDVLIPTFTSFVQKPTLRTKQSYLQYFYDTLYRHWDILSKWSLISLLEEKKTFHISNIQSIFLSSEILTPDITVVDGQKFIEISIELKHRGSTYQSQDMKIYHGKLIRLGDTFYRHNRSDMSGLLEMMGDGKIYFPKAQRAVIMQDLLMPLVKAYNIQLPEEFYIDIESYDMMPIVSVKEDKEKFLSILPQFGYGDVIFSKYSNQQTTFQGDKTRFISRDKAAEDEFFVYIKSLHQSFKYQAQGPFQLPNEEVMKNNWFITFTQQLFDKGIKIDGLSALKKFKYNTAIPTWNMTVNSGIDWFDIHITATWGDQVLGFKEIKKAVSSGQNYIILNDGSLGMIPDEWVTKYGMLLKISKEQGDAGIVSKKQFGIVDMLYNEIDNEQVRQELDDKKKNLLELNHFEPYEIPTQINATLRPYQETGYQWMQMLDKVSWGGCLADDMGLGKTLQAITFLQYIKNKNGSPTSLIVCPTSLIYNWQNEFDKFAPDLRYYIYYGQGRAVENLDLGDYDIIITSYGVARNDIENLMEYQWEYIILDESQTIKNPDAGVTKALMLYKARNRFILSGTPMQNNTFDLYAQFHFLNPGILGTRDFFRTEFATQIDKNNNKDVSILLKQIIKPFMLRRTKTEVAVDLPEKTESIIWCQMSSEQQELYDTYKNFYRGALTQKIASDGIGKAGIYILEGLLRLRQICDDPRLIKETETPTKRGVKIIELIREIKENIGDHKILVFSQFTEMLGLIREDLDHENINYAYIDGSVSAKKRKTEVDTFQDDDQTKIFLISLKAGGIGLNLTAADYVYIVDPWWNPAVEQQAIDRAHRIGQTKNIFAYKMICKGSVEEKILKLQEKKLNISKDILGEDNAFFKKLTMDDIQYLFS